MHELFKTRQAPEPANSTRTETLILFNPLLVTMALDELFSAAGLEGIIDHFLPELLGSIDTIIIVLASVALYSVVIFHFYRFLGKRDVFKFNVERYRVEQTGILSRIRNMIVSILKYGLVFPIIVFLWFAGYTIMLFLLAKNLGVEQILLVSVVFVSAIRLTSYYSEDLSKDLAKMIPFALLGIAIVDPQFFSIDIVGERISSLPPLITRIAGFFVFITLLEWVLRLLLFVKNLFFPEVHTQDFGRKKKE
jgi:hypothetical protein